MGSCLKFYIKTAPGERVETELTLPPDAGGVVTGIISRSGGEPAAAAVVVAVACETGQPMCHCVADSQGFFVLGPLPPALYDIHVYDGAAPIRAVKIEV